MGYGLYIITFWNNQMNDKNFNSNQGNENLTRAQNAPLGGSPSTSPSSQPEKPIVERRNTKKHGINKRKVKLSLIVGFVGFSGLFLAFALYSGIGEIWVNLKKIDAQLILMLVGLSLVNFSLRGCRWYLFSCKLKLGVGFWASIRIYLAGFGLMVTPAKAGEVIRLWLINKSYNQPYRLLAPMIIADRESDAIAFVWILVFTVSSFGGNYEALVWLFVTYVMGKLLLIYNPQLLKKGVLVAHRMTRKRYKRFWASVVIGAKATRKLFAPDIIVQSLLLTLVGWLAEIAALWLLLDAFGAHLPFNKVAFIFIFSMAVGAATLTPGGLGGAEATMITLIVGQLVAFGIAPLIAQSEALTATAVVRLSTFWFAVFLGLVMLFISVRISRRDYRKRTAVAK